MRTLEQKRWENGLKVIKKIYEDVEKVMRKWNIEAKGDKIDRFWLEVRTLEQKRQKMD